MALFSRKTKKDTAAEVSPAVATSNTSGVRGDLTHVLHSPRITEKASMHMERACYVFKVAANANKKQISAAIREVYKVTPRKVAIVNIRTKSVRNMRTGQTGVKGGGKKAYVYLKRGETITIT